MIRFIAYMSGKIKVLHVLHGLPRGGLENGVVNLLNRLPAQEFEHAVCCLDLRGEMAQRIETAVEIFELHRKPHDYQLPFRLAALVRNWRPDIIHCRNWNTWLDSCAAHLIDRRRAKLVWSFHGFADGDNFPLRRRVISNMLARVTDYLFAVCKDSAQRYAKVARVPAQRFDVIYNGVDCDKFTPPADVTRLREELGLNTQEIIVTTVASLTPVKDHAKLLRAIALAHRLSPDVSTRFLFIGEGALRVSLQSEIQNLGLEGKVNLLGNSDRVADYLAASDVFILPSRLEGMSNAIMEAMATGLPVIANNVGGNPELVKSGSTGILCEQNNDQDMANAILQLAKDKTLREKMGMAARQRAEEVFSIASMMKAYENYYKRVANTGS